MSIVLIALFVLPLIARAAIFAMTERPATWRDADWSSSGLLPTAGSFPDARILVFTGQTGGWKGLFAVHSWIVLKPPGASTWTRYDVVGWGAPIRVNGWPADGRWFGNRPSIVADIQGDEASALIPRIEAAIRTYPYRHPGDYRLWPGPNSNTFVASVLRAVPELGVTLPPNAIGKDYCGGLRAGPTATRSGLEMCLWGIAGVTLGRVEGLEVNLLGLVAGLDLRQPAVKLPAFGRVGLSEAVIGTPQPR